MFQWQKWICKHRETVMPPLVESRVVQHLRGGGDTQECTLLEVANWFADQYLPSDLTQVSVRFPDEKRFRT